MDVARARAHGIAAASLLVGMLLAGCSSGSPAPLSSPASSGPVGSVPAAAASTIPPSGATATAKASKGGVISVDLAITGTLPLTLHGTAGQCSIGHRPDGTGVFQYFANPGDFPGIGQGLFLTESRLGSDPTPVLGVKLLPPEGPWFGDFAGGFQFSGDHKTLTIDADLPTNPGKPEHMKGTVVCA